jgi:hypothetical protein
VNADCGRHVFWDRTMGSLSRGFLNREP